MARLLLIMGLVLGGCSAPSPSWKLADQFVTFATFPLQLLDAETGEPLADVEIARIEKIPEPESLRSRLLYGNNKTVHTPVAKTNAQGIAGIPMRFRSEKLVFHVGSKLIQLNCEQSMVYEIDKENGIQPHLGNVTTDEKKHVVVNIYRAKPSSASTSEAARWIPASTAQSK